MAVKIGSRLSRPSDWKETVPGTWEISVPGGSHRAHGNVQCVICGEPIEATPGECDKDNQCFHVLANYLQGMKVSKAWRKRIEEWLHEPNTETMKGG